MFVTQATKSALLLEHVRVLDLGDDVGSSAARLLADLGADTIRAEIGAAAPATDRATGVRTVLRDANKRRVAIDHETPAGRDSIDRLLAGADLAFIGPEAAAHLNPQEVAANYPQLVVVATSPFGLTGPRAHWQATGRTLLALSGAMSRSGRPGARPLVPPATLADATVAAQAAWTGLVAFVQQRNTGQGQLIDLSAHEAVSTGLDPAFGVQGSAAAGRGGQFRRDRPPADSYPIYRCKDGYVRLCLLAKRQWRGMFTWLGEPEEFADPKFDSITARVAAADQLEPVIQAHFADRLAAELVDEATSHGVPLAPVLTLGEAVTAAHFRESGTVAAVDLGTGHEVEVPVGYIDVDGERLGIRCVNQPVSELTLEWTPRETVGELGDSAGGPLSGLRVLDLGVIVFGAEAGRAFADLGADVIKVESQAFPDGLRQTRNGEPMNASFAWGNRGKRSIGLDLRSPDGRRLFLDLVRASDVVLSNFKPGTLDSLGIGFEALSAANPGVIVLESSAFSYKGPWSRRLGYGPLVRAACGVTSLWKYAPEDTESWDGVTVFPDHVAARLAALTILAALIERSRTGRGRHVRIAQSDAVLYQFADLAALEQLDPGSIHAVGNRGRELFGGTYECAGDDDWSVVDVRTEAERAALSVCVGVSVTADDGELETAVAAWCRTRSPLEVTEELQGLGLPAAPMLRLPELLDDPQLQARKTYRPMRHPLLDASFPSENSASPYGALELAEATPAPLSGADTKKIVAEVIHLDAETTTVYVEAGVLHCG